MTSASAVGSWICRVQVKNFRRFAEAEWSLKPGINCLIGAGDAGKTTLLTAIEFVTWPTYSLVVTDNDFHRGRIDRDLVITAWIANPPAELRTDNKFLGYLQGFMDGAVFDAPTESADDLTALQIELRVASDLEPVWSVVKPPLPPCPIRAIDRAGLGVSRIGEELGRHLRWGRGSALMRLSPDTREAHDVLRRATRESRKTSSPQLAEALVGITEPITDASRELRGLSSDASLSAGNDLDDAVRGLGHVSLHTEADIPIARSGQGTQRILAIASQLSAISSARLLLLDELEQGLEPHRVQHLIAALRSHVTKGEFSQIVLTTHSPRVLRELRAAELTRVDADHADILRSRDFPIELQGLVRWSPDALLAQRVVVCEGATEAGLVRGLVSLLQEQTPPRYATVEAADAMGKDNVVVRSNGLRSMGYDTAALYDLDVEPKDIEQLAVGVQRFYQEPGCSTEDQLLRDLSDAGVRRLVGLAASVSAVDAEKLNEKLCSRGCTADEANALLNGTEAVSVAVRTALGATAKKDGWFKQIALGELVIKCCRSEIRPGSHLAVTLARLEGWMTGQ